MYQQINTHISISNQGFISMTNYNNLDTVTASANVPPQGNKLPGSTVIK
jgi:hypothetical protein